jgi:DNA-binding Lrp family transcriptional regulator
MAGRTKPRVGRPGPGAAKIAPRTSPATDRPPEPAIETVALDSVDLKLIELLQADGRLSNRSMSKVVGLKEAAVATRIRSLTDQKVLGVSALIDWERAGYDWDYWLHIDVEGRAVQDVADEIAKFETVTSVQMIFGTADLVVHVVAQGRAAVSNFLAEELAQVDGIRALHSSVALETMKFNVQFASLPFDATPPKLPNPIVEINEFDEEILMEFMRDGRQSHRQVARNLGVSDSTIRLRLGRMEGAKLVRMCAQVDPLRTRLLRAWAYVGISVVDANKHDVCAQLAEIPEVIVLSLVTGKHDIFILAAASKRRRLLDVVARQIREIEGVHRTDLEEVIETVKFDFRWARLSPSD